MDLTEFADGLDTTCEGMRGLKDGSKVFFFFLGQSKEKEKEKIII